MSKGHKRLNTTAPQSRYRSPAPLAGSIFQSSGTRKTNGVIQFSGVSLTTSGLLRCRSQWRCVSANEWNKPDDPVFWNKFENIWITSLPARNDGLSSRVRETSVAIQIKIKIGLHENSIAKNWLPFSAKICSKKTPFGSF